MKEKPSIGPDRRFQRFKEILESHFLGIDKEHIDEKKEAFISELNKLDLSSSEIFENLIYYFNQIHQTAQMKTTGNPLHTKRDFALDLFAKVFSDLVRDAMGVEVTTTDFLMFLVGIIDDPYTSTPKSKEIELYAKEDDTVLITGETGTGKEFHAKVIHYLSGRSKERFMAINCAGIPDTLLESELFGIIKGVATNISPKEGILSAVGEGTLFLDEIGDMPLALQAKILRVLQEREFYKVGDPKNVCKFRGRVIAATNKDLKAGIKEFPPKFRPDLFYRLNVLPIRLLSLWELPDPDRESAILNNLRHVIYSKTKEPGDWPHMDFLSDRGSPTIYIDNNGDVIAPENPFISKEALQYLMNYDFPGNYRELDNIIGRAYVLSEKKKIELSALPDEVRNYKRSESPQSAIDTSGIDKVFLKDIVDHADKIKKDIVRRKVESVCGKGRNLKRVLRDEDIKEEQGYQTIRKRIVGVIGKEEMSRILKG